MKNYKLFGLIIFASCFYNVSGYSQAPQAPQPAQAGQAAQPIRPLVCPPQHQGKVLVGMDVYNGDPRKEYRILPNQEGDKLGVPGRDIWPDLNHPRNEQAFLACSYENIKQELYIPIPRNIKTCYNDRNELGKTIRMICR